MSMSRMSRRQEYYAMQLTDCQDESQNKCYAKLETNLGFRDMNPNRAAITREGFKTKLNKFFDIIQNTECPVVMLKFNCIIHNYLLRNVDWIFGEYADATVPARFVRFINTMLSNTNARLTIINDGLIIGVDNIRLIDMVHSTLEDTIRLFTPQLNSWKLRTGYLEPAPQVLPPVLLQQ